LAFRKQEKKDAKAKLLRISASKHGIHPNQICEKTKDVLQRLTKAGYEAYLVGGAVRDLMLGKQPKDFDIATSASPEQVRRVFSRSCRLIGRRFRLAHIYYGRFYLEVATFRAPHDESGKGLTANDGRIIHDNVYGTLEQDALRRDFTINALFYDLETGDVLDYVSGVKDLRAGKLRLIGDPEQRYREDPVRMLRAIRFSSKLDLQIDESAKAPIQELAHLLDNIAPARLFDESLKLFHSGQAAKTLDQLRDHKLFFHLFPLTEMGLHDENFYNFVKLALGNTDKRIRSGLSVTPAFLYAVMLWRGVQKYAQDNIDLGQAPHQAYHVAASEILKEQAQTTGIPRRFAQMSRDIWTLQTRFIYRDCRRSMNFLTNNRFRAAYDFYCLRTATEDDLDEESCQWWTDFQKGNDKHKLVMCRPFKKGGRRPRKKKPQNNAK
jgi:poly(A) polymerase